MVAAWKGMWGPFVVAAFSVVSNFPSCCLLLLSLVLKNDDAFLKGPLIGVDALAQPLPCVSVSYLSFYIYTYYY
jgi:hypothetical protein